jgi:hypothetical protein
LIFFLSVYYCIICQWSLEEKSRRLRPLLGGNHEWLCVRAQCTVPSMAAAQWILSVRQPGEQKASWMKSQPQNYHRRFNGVLE